MLKCFRKHLYCSKKRIYFGSREDSGEKFTMKNLPRYQQCNTPIVSLWTTALKTYLYSQLSLNKSKYLSELYQG